MGDPKIAKNRLHLDFRPDHPGVEVHRLVRLGALRVDTGQGEQPWVVAGTAVLQGRTRSPRPWPTPRAMTCRIRRARSWSRTGGRCKSDAAGSVTSTRTSASSPGSCPLPRTNSGALSWQPVSCPGTLGPSGSGSSVADAAVSELAADVEVAVVPSALRDVILQGLRHRGVSSDAKFSIGILVGPRSRVGATHETLLAVFVPPCATCYARPRTQGSGIPLFEDPWPDGRLLGVLV
ncbi:MAG: VOC family protein [Nostocoides sp.]